MEIKNIIFDYGNVIFAIDFQRTQTAFANLGIQNVSSFFAHKGHHPIFDEFEKGNLSPDEFRNEFRAIVGLSLSDETIDKAWNSLLIGVPKENHELLLEVKKKYRTFLLSNNNEIHYQWILNYLNTEHGLKNNDSFFEKTYYSQHTGLRKPDPKIFQMLVDQHQLNPQETLFVDDSPQHIAGAQKIGLHTLLMEKPVSQLSEILKSHHII